MTQCGNKKEGSLKTWEVGGFGEPRPGLCVSLERGPKGTGCRSGKEHVWVGSPRESPPERWLKQPGRSSALGPTMRLEGNKVGGRDRTEAVSHFCHDAS